MKNSKLRVLDKNARWWSHEKDVTKWAIKDKQGNWWLVGGSEFPEKKVKDEKKMSCGLPPTFDFKRFFLNIFYAILLGCSLGLNIFFILNEIF